MNDVDLGWLVGTFDGEGAIGLTKSQPARQSTPTITPNIQMETTCERTAEKLVALIDDLDVAARSYFYRGRKPQHRGTWNLRINRLADAKLVAAAMRMHAVTKQAQWELLYEFVTSRLVGATFDATGRVHRGGKAKPYTAREIAIYAEMRALNTKGPR